MTAAQQLRQEGVQQSMQEGRHAKALDIAKEMLSELRLDMQTAAQQLGKKYEQKGRQQEKLLIAKKMLDAHESKEKVQQFTGLSWVEIEQLAREETSR
jgi:hypothetical protein